MHDSKDKYLYDYEHISKRNIDQYECKNKISVIIPVYNEEKSIKKVIEAIPNHYEYEIIVVNDGSSDNTLEVLKKIEREIKIINHKINRGYGASILRGFAESTGEYIITIDSDGQHDPKEIPFLLKPLIQKQADIVVGSRYKGKSEYKVPLYTRAGEYIVNLFLWFLFHQKVGNNQSGFRAFSARSKQILKNMVYTKFGLCTETLFKAAYNNLKIVEVPITISSRKFGKSRVNIFRILKTIISCVILYFAIKINLKRFVPRKLYHQAHIIFTKIFDIVN